MTADVYTCIFADAEVNYMELGERRAPAKEARRSFLTIRVNQQEKEALKGLAAGAGISVGGYLLGLALGNSIVDTIADKPDSQQMRLDV